MKPIDLKKQWSEICRVLKEQVDYLEQGRLMYPVVGDPMQFTEKFINRLRSDIASLEALSSNFKYATFHAESTDQIAR